MTSHFGTPRVLALLPRGECYRNFIYTGALEEVIADVDLLAVAPTPEIFGALAASFERVERLEPVDENRLVRLTRAALDAGHGAYLDSEAARERARRRDAEVEGSVDWIKRSGWKMAASALGGSRRLDLVDRLDHRLSAVLATDTSAIDTLDELSPDLVFNTSHIHAKPVAPYLHEATRRGITTAAFLFSWDNLTSQGRMMPTYDDYLVWNEPIAADLLRIYPRTDPARVHVTGTPQFDQHFLPENEWSRAEFCELVGLDAGLPFVLYTTGMPNHMPNEPEIVERLVDDLRRRAGDEVQVLVRVYAKDTSGQFDELAARRPDIIFAPVHWERRSETPLPEDAPVWTNCLRHAACGVNVASSVSLELFMFDRPVVNIACNPPSVSTSEVDYARYYRFDHYRPLVESASVELVESLDRMGEAVLDAVVHPSTRAGGRRRVLEDMFGETLDGKCHVRVAGVLTELVSR